MRPLLARCHITDCAVCKQDYAPGVRYSCRSCVGKDRMVAIGLFSCFTVAALVVIAFLVVRLLEVVGDPTQEGDELEWVGRRSLLRRLIDAVPMKAVKIIVVVWQIVGQVSLYCFACIHRDHMTSLWNRQFLTGEHLSECMFLYLYNLLECKPHVFSQRSYRTKVSLTLLTTRYPYSAQSLISRIHLSGQ